MGPLFWGTTHMQAPYVETRAMGALRELWGPGGFVGDKRAAKRVFQGRVFSV